MYPRLTWSLLNWTAKQWTCHHEKQKQLRRETGQLCPDGASNYPQTPSKEHSVLLPFALCCCYCCCCVNSSIICQSEQKLHSWVLTLKVFNVCGWCGVSLVLRNASGFSQVDHVLYHNSYTTISRAQVRHIVFGFYTGLLRNVVLVPWYKIRPLTAPTSSGEKCGSDSGLKRSLLCSLREGASTGCRPRNSSPLWNEWAFALHSPHQMVMPDLQQACPQHSILIKKKKKS